MPAGSNAASPDPVAATWAFDSHLVGFEKSDGRNAFGYGTVIRYRAVMSDGVERDVIHGQALDRRKPRGRSTDLTMCSAPPLSMGTEGMMMHFLLKSMEMGVD